MHPDSTTKRCTKCGEIKPLDSFHNDRTTRDGHSYHCKACHHSAAHAHYAENRAAINAKNAEYRNNNRAVIKAQRAKYRARNLEATKEAARQRYYTNQESRKASVSRRYHEHADVRARAKQTAREWNRNHPKQVNAIARARRKANPDQATAYKQNRRARVLGNGGSFTAKQWRDLKATYNHRCLCCGKSEPEIKLTADHIIPLELGGSSDISNIQPLCGSCNSQKSARHIDYRTS